MRNRLIGSTTFRVSDSWQRPAFFDGDDPPPEPDDQTKKMIAAAVAEATKGLKEKNDELLGKNKTLTEQVETMNKQWAGLDPEKVAALLKAAESDEETKLLAEGKVDDVVSLRVDKALKAKDAEIEKRDARIVELESEVGKRDEKLTEMVLDSAIRDAAAEISILPSAVEDALTRGRRVFSLDKDGNVVAKNAEGTVVLGKDAKTPMSPAEWLEDMKAHAPHWWAPSSGGGATGGDKGSTTKVNPFMPATRNITEQMRLKRHEPKVYERLKAEAEAARSAA